MSSERHGKEDEDGLFLEQVLDSLYDFGSEPKRKSKSQKNKKRKQREEEEEEEEKLPTVNDICGDTEGAGVHVSTDGQPKTKHKSPDIQQVEVVTFQDPTKKPNTKRTPESNKTPIPEQKQNGRQEQLSLEKARLEVHRFGITGYKKEQQRVFEQDRAIMLGARPPKKDYVNYKALQQQIKEKKQKEKEEFQPDKKKKKKRSNQRDNKQPSSSGSGSASSGLVGRFKNGVLLLSPNDIQKIKGHK